MAHINEKNQNRIIIKNSAVSIVCKGLSYLLSFLTTPVLLSCLGDAKYGIYTTALSLVSWIYYFDFGIGSGLRNKVTESMVKEDRETAQKLVSVAYMIITLVSLGAFMLVFILNFFIDFDDVLNARLSDENLNHIMLLAIFMACTNFVLSLSKSVMLAIQKIGLVDIFGIIAKIFMIIALFVYSRTGRSEMLIVVLIEGLSELLKNLIACCYIDKKYPFLMPSFKSRPDYSCSKEILGFGIQIFIMQISALVLNATDNMIIMKLYSSVDVTPYSLAHKYFTVINVFFVAATGSLWATYTTAYAMNDLAYIKKTLKKAMQFYAITFVGIILAYILYTPFMRIYLGRDIEYQPGLVLLVGAYYALLIFSHNFSCFVHGISKVKYTTIACAVSAVANIPVSIFLATRMGLRINGVIMGSIVSLMITTPVYMYTAFSEMKKMKET